MWAGDYHLKVVFPRLFSISSQKEGMIYSRVGRLGAICLGLEFLMEGGEGGPSRRRKC